MFNSPINKLFGIPPVGQGGKQEQGKKDEKEDSQKQNKNIFEEETPLYMDVSTEGFDIEEYVRRFFEDVMRKEQTERTYKKIGDFLSKFNLSDFKRKYGENLSKEDVSVILYSIAEKFGAEI